MLPWCCGRCSTSARAWSSPPTSPGAGAARWCRRVAGAGPRVGTRAAAPAAGSCTGTAGAETWRTAGAEAASSSSGVSPSVLCSHHSLVCTDLRRHYTIQTHVLCILPSFSRLGEEDLDIKDWVEADTDLGLGDENRFRDITCHVRVTDSSYHRSRLVSVPYF